MPVMFRPMRAEDKDLFANFIRSLPRKDNYYLLVDVNNDQTIQRWMDKVESWRDCRRSRDGGCEYDWLLQS